jgi:hypothetical protein
MKEKNIDLAEKSIEILDKLMGRVDWDDSALLKFYLERIQTLRNEQSDFHERLIKDQAYRIAKQQLTEAKGNFKLNELNSLVLYVPLSQSDGSSLTAWEKLLVQLPSFANDQAIYQEEKYIRKFISTQKNIENEAYVSVRVAKEHLVVHPSQEEKDSLGQPLVCVKEDSILVSNVLFFVHANAAYYDFFEYHLKKHL